MVRPGKLVRQGKQDAFSEIHAKRGLRQEHLPTTRGIRTCPAGRGTRRGSILFRCQDIFHSEADDMKQSALRTYMQVAILVQQGQIGQALELAVTIPVDHLRGRALLLANYSRRL